MNEIPAIGLIGDQLPEYERAQRAAVLMIERAEEAKLIAR
jgi:hypothetical protein